MKLREFLSGLREDKEVEVRDTKYENVLYFYGGEGSNDSLWDKAVANLADMLVVEDITDGYVVVNLSSLIEQNYDLLEKAGIMDMLNIVDKEDLADTIEDIVTGDINECIFAKFVSIMKDGDYDSDRENCAMTYKILKKMCDIGETCYIIDKDTGKRGYVELDVEDESCCVYFEDEGIYEEGGMQMLVEEFDHNFDIVDRELLSRGIL